MIDLPFFLRHALPVSARLQRFSLKCLCDFKLALTDGV
jgi:hypothetical protein